MRTWPSNGIEPTRRGSFAGVLLAALAACPAAGAQPPAEPVAPATPAREAELEERVRRLEELNRRALEQFESLSKKYEALERRLGPEAGAVPTADPPPPAPSPSPPASDAPASGAGPSGPVVGDDATAADIERPPDPSKVRKGPGTSHFRADYDNGFVIAPDDEDERPFLLRVNGRMQFRHTVFSRDRDFWWDSAGDRLRIKNRDDFEIERGRLTFSGFFLSPKLEYFLNFDFDTDDNHNVNAHDFWVDYRFGKAFALYFGKAFVPGSRAWLAGSTRTQFADRPLANTFFRPDRSVGVWAQGEPFENVHYRAMLANGFNTTDLNVEDIDLNFAWSGSTWWDVFGNYGPGLPDLEWHDDLAVLTGTSFTAAKNSGPGPVDQPPLEQNFVRLSDGTRLTLPNALAPGLTVNRFDIYLWALDAAAKYRGFSMNAEYYVRWVQDIGGVGGAAPFTTMFDHGFYAEGGYFLVPKKLEVIARTSQIWGPFGSGSEYAGGLNWYINGTHDWKFTFDATRVIGSPAQNAGPNYKAGDTGVMFRSQLQTAF